MTQLERRIGGVDRGSLSTVYALDVAGQRLLSVDGRARPPWTPSTLMTKHTLECSELFVRLVEAHREGTLELINFDTEPRCWRHTKSDQGEAWTLKPDADLTLGLGDEELHWFVEIDLASESRPRITRKAKDYISYLTTGDEQARRGVTPRILFVVPTERRRELVIDAVRRVDAAYWHLFVVCLPGDLVGVLTSEPRA